MCLIVGELVEDIKKQLDYIIGALIGGVVDKETTTILFHLYAFVDTTKCSPVTIQVVIYHTFKVREQFLSLYFHDQRARIEGKFAKIRIPQGGIHAPSNRALVASPCRLSS